MGKGSRIKDKDSRLYYDQAWYTYSGNDTLCLGPFVSLSLTHFPLPYLCFNNPTTQYHIPVIKYG
jgi:hypothetical protein